MLYIKLRLEKRQSTNVLSFWTLQSWSVTDQVYYQLKQNYFIFLPFRLRGQAGQTSEIL